MATPIAGNQNYTKVDNIAAPVSTLNAGQLKVSTLEAGQVTAGLLHQEFARPGLGSLRQAVAYAPSGFATAGASSVHFLNNSPNSAAATSASDPQLFLLPAGATVVDILLTNNGTTVAGGTTFDLGTLVWTASPGALTGNLLTATTTALVNSATGLRAGQSTAPTAFGGLGAANVGVGPVAANTGLAVEVLGAANTSGDLAVLVTYMV